MPGPVLRRQACLPGQGEDDAHPLDPVAPDEDGAVVERALLDEDAFEDRCAQVPAQEDAFPQVFVQCVAVLEDKEGAGPRVGQMEGRHDRRVRSYPLGVLSGPAQEEADRAGLDQHVADLVAEDHDDDQHGHRAEGFEEPAGQDESGGPRGGVQEPENEQTHQDPKRRGAAEQEQEPMGEEAEDQEVNHLRPFWIREISH